MDAAFAAWVPRRRDQIHKTHREVIGIRTARDHAALDIRNWPDSSPVTLQDPAYVCVAVMAMQGRPGYTRIRDPYVSDADAARVADATSHLTADPDLCLDALLRTTGRTAPPTPSLTK
jgi:S-DNA-T family DNA segregation ATPase FtsK/SpoIIIE